MRQKFFALLFLFFCLSANAQKANISYTIQGNYDEDRHLLDGLTKIKYLNTSGKPMSKIYLHLWANAYSDKNSAYTKQSVRAGNIDFVYAGRDKMGGYEKINVTTEGQKLKIGYENPEIAFIVLNQPLEDQEEIIIDIDYQLQMPPKYDRFGYKGGDVFFSHFYPKVVVNKRGKWHKMPYLLYGEGYSEYADFDINIHFNDYQSIASGRIISQSPHHLDFNANNVVDVAFAISKTKNIQAFQSGDINIKVLGHEKINEETVRKCINYLEQRIGIFPYTELSIYVDGTNGGMEYPGMITIPASKDAQEYYLIHELAHEYFYGAMHNNQRTEAWIDEGFATFYQKEYFKDNYDEHYYSKLLPKFIKSDQPLLHGFTEHQIARNFADKLKTKAENSSPANYIMNHYELSATYIGMVHSQLGRKEFDKHIQRLYSSKQNKHITGDQVIDNFPASAQWLKKAVTSSSNTDYAIESFKNGVLTIKNKGENAFPYPIVLGDNQKTIWVEGHEGLQHINVDSEYKKAAIDPHFVTIDANRRNNYTRRKLSITPPKLFSNPGQKSIYVSPYLGYNTSDKFMVGLGFSNGFLPYNNTKVFVAPSYAFGSKSVTGIIDLRHDFNFKEKAYRKLQLGLQGKRFSIKEKPYAKVSPFVSLHFDHGNTSQSFSKITLTSHHINYDYDSKTISDQYRTSDWTNIQNLRYSYYNFFVLYPSEINIDIEHQSYRKALQRTEERYIKLTGEWKQGFAYKKNKSIDFRLFGGIFLMNTDRSSSNYNSPLFTRGSLSMWGDSRQDLGLNDYFFNRRNDYDGFLSRQVSDYNTGGFKTAIPQGYKIGLSNDYLVSAGIKADLPIDLPLGINLKAFFDYGFYNSKATQNSKFAQKGLYSGGVMIEVADGLLSLHLPLLNSNEIRNIYKENGIKTLGKVSFKLDIKRFNLFDLADDFNP